MGAPSAEGMEAIHATYRKIGTLGHGSFGKVYLVLHAPSKELRVLKQMDVDGSKISDDKDPRKEALREAWVLKKMNHPFIISYHDVFVTPRQKMCIVMSYADCGDLHTFLKRRRGLLAEEEVLRMFTQLCLALDHVHQQRVIHRDLKSQNVFLHGIHRTVKLGDFGISRVLEQTRDLAHTMVGTPYYLSPEIIMEQPYGFKSDIWSMGVILYEMLTLRHPFDGRNIQHLAMRILNLKFDDPDKTKYSAESCEMVRMLLTRESEKRPSCDDILNTQLLRGYVLRELDKCKELDYKLRDSEVEVRSNKNVKLPALQNRPTGFVARIRGLTK
ncbi:serine/threonine-protein kinase Nek3, putative [Perkinsus marinus ATCC 50983]|uniref:non-specific serine/threonine protein kinase n=1 Tax=Perkinsus marinus (strain ATCC 50983 / TXsc) TaxID=423536 RepID=C5LZ92_PERM5|nr:serine/threonine-protein kinase Nek3, putative [Perkinsus marinus ATCC 50983]EEQ97886.1 serine/threonine-protein kinase Nek3, putative [Perkinsus marinus ATCC 50983]|eukprot:XP_002765169.1 serine/threonine-protein kinase Nek3, putative [Perkinsus marinus ATCC 50983]